MSRPATQHKQVAYPAYKPSGVAWLGDIPEHWEIRRLKYTAVLINVKVDGADNDLPYTGLEHIESWTGKRISPNGDATSEGQANLYHRGDVLFGKLRPYLAKAHAADSDGICTGELLVLRPKVVHQKFLVDYVLNPDFVAIVDSSTYGAKMPRANWDFIGNLPALVPPFPEQRAIAAFLDRETTRIEALIEKKRRQIELLQEKRSALISHAVTKGLEPNAKMKDSGVEWLGEIPEYWDVVKLRRITTSRCDGPFGSGLKSNHYTNEGVRVVRLQNIRFASFDQHDQAFIDSEYYMELGDHDVLAGDLLIAGLGDDRNPVGRACVAPVDIEPAMVKADCFRFRLNRAIAAAPYMAFQLSTAAAALGGAWATGTTRSRMNLSETGDRPVALPPLAEQRQIADVLAFESGKIDALTDKIECSIELLREHRTALISAAVTGKIDVREEGHE